LWRFVGRSKQFGSFCDERLCSDRQKISKSHLFSPQIWQTSLGVVRKRTKTSEGEVISSTFAEIEASCQDLQSCSCCGTPTEATSFEHLCLDCQADADESRWELDRIKERIFESQEHLPQDLNETFQKNKWELLA
jgi:hypothetical protein